ncbi:MAG: hypothetical protein EYC70_01410 [Planctomycetota bacterium]|nr:MAG: hypothetical protein EYC70_01410 [Planctomycetota bacterium]
MRRERIWPDGQRYLWTDAFGVVLLLSLGRATGDKRFTGDACRLVREVERVLGRERGLRIGEAPDRDGQYFHYLAMWLFALGRLGRVDPAYRTRALELVREIHRPFVIPGRGVWWKMREDLSGPYPGYGLGALDPYHGYFVYRLLDEAALAAEIAEMRELMEASYAGLVITQDLGLGMMLWLTRFFPQEPWAQVQRGRCLQVLDAMWIEPDGYFCREPGLPNVKFAFTNYGVAIGLQAVGAMPERVQRLRSFFRKHRSGDAYDTAAITHVMACCAEFPGELLQPGDSPATPR